MANYVINPVAPKKMSTEDFKKIAQFITKEFGVKMPINKKLMLEGRLHRRLVALNFTTYRDYIEYVLSPNGLSSELVHMMDVVTTHKTDFFREPVHFSFLMERALPEYQHQLRYNKPLKIWSAGSSSGEEAYTIAMVLEDFTNNGVYFDYQILATDISMQMLQDTSRAVYPMERVAPVPMEYKKRFMLASKDKSKPTVRMKPHLRKKVNVKWLNLIDNDYSIYEEFDIVFCRNVLIYFDRANQEHVINKLCSNLKKGGYFFLGHSETIANMDVPLKTIMPTVFVKE